MSLKAVWIVGGFVVLAAACGDTVIEESGPADNDDEVELPLAGDACDTREETIDCGADAGSMSCFEDLEGKLSWSACAVPACHEGDAEECFTMITFPGQTEPTSVSGRKSCELSYEGVWQFGRCVDSASSTPLVFAFDDAPVSFSSSAGSFSLDPTMSVATDWPAATTPWLALDRNGNGAIDDGGELFGSATVIGSGGHASNGFVALRPLDQNRDGVLDARDPAFASLTVWSDVDQDRASRPSELVSLASLGIESISLAFGDAARCDGTGNCERETSTFVYRGADGASRQGRVVDVHLAHR
jgi:hypothetical protein